MEEKTKIFVLGNLSKKSSSYILNSLFKNTVRIEAEMLSFDDNNKKDIFIIGNLDESGLELYIIMDSLFRRIKGTRERINDLYIDEDGPEEIAELLSEMNRRLKELESDWAKIRDFLYNVIEIKFQKEIQEILNAQSDLLKERFHWSDYNSYAGYIFVFFKQKIFGITNYFPVGGD